MLPTRNPFIRVEEEAAVGPRPLSRPRMAVSARRLRAAAHREHHRRVAGRLHRPSPADDLQRQHDYRPACCASRSRRTSASPRPANCGRHNPSQIRPRQPAVVQRRRDQRRPDPAFPQSAEVVAIRARRRRRSPPGPDTPPPVGRTAPPSARSAAAADLSQVQHDHPADAERHGLGRDLRRLDRSQAAASPRAMPPLRSSEKTIRSPNAAQALPASPGPATVSRPMMMFSTPASANRRGRPSAWTPASIQRRKPSRVPGRRRRQGGFVADDGVQVGEVEFRQAEVRAERPRHVQRPAGAPSAR